MGKITSISFEFNNWFHYNYILIFIAILFLYLLFAFIAPVMLHFGYERIGNAIYSVYRNLCHQFAHRSWFLFGEQSFYPGVIEENSKLKLYSEMFGVDAVDLETSRMIIGNKTAGYKVAICQRDVMLYLSLLTFSIIFLFSKKIIKKIPFLVWFIFAVLPIGIDGGWQLLTTINLFNLPTHESTPLIRSITGALFGFFSGWYLLPSIADAFDNNNTGKVI